MKKMVFWGIVLLFCINSLQAQSGNWSNVVFSGENERLLEGSTWQFNQQGGIRFEFRRGGRLVSSVSDFSIKATWERDGDIVKMVYAAGAVLIEGVYYPETQRILGTRYTSSGSTDITLVPVGTTDVSPTVPSTSSSSQNQIHNTPPANSPSPAQPAPAPATPAGWNLSVLSGANNIGGTWTSSVGRGNFMVLNGNGSSGTVNVQANGIASTGTVTVSGNTLNIYITSGQFAGQQFRYTIVSNRLIQGDGENFSR
jgi:hypothetical protein